ncbi:unnamed protein product [Oncorhynchus mykiss]|uniref:N-acetyltransferase domain-containing protein n=1 Tax=Oncorhynchus mykiss TaxID=8022 RepID=A0A060W5F6_ONCMY|nr:unnamed protein product [Oncorhynchus mykiss]
MDFSIRASTLEDCKDIARMILELAEYEKVLDQVKVTQKGRLIHSSYLQKSLFNFFVCLLAYQQMGSMCHAKVGYALYFYTYSSWKGRALYMEDLYVMPEFRGKGIGKALMSKVAQLGLAAGCTQLNFAVLDWNKPSLDFYLSQGCFDVTADMGYHCMRCEGAALEQLAQGDT